MDSVYHLDLIPWPVDGSIFANVTSTNDNTWWHSYSPNTDMDKCSNVISNGTLTLIDSRTCNCIPDTGSASIRYASECDIRDGVCIR